MKIIKNNNKAAVTTERVNYNYFFNYLTLKYCDKTCCITTLSTWETVNSRPLDKRWMKGSICKNYYNKTIIIIYVISTELFFTKYTNFTSPESLAIVLNLQIEQNFTGIYR